MRADQYQIAGAEIRHMVAGKTSAPAFQDQGKLKFGMKMIGGRKGAFAKYLQQERMTGRLLQDLIRGLQDRVGL